MFYETGSGSGHKKAGLAHSPLSALVVPRPIGWISTVAADGTVNLAPFSYFNLASYLPPMVMFAANGGHPEGGDKDTLKNVRDCREFVVNLCTWDLRVKMNDTSTPAPRSVDEFELVGLTKAPSRLVKPPRVAESPVHLECRLLQVVELPGHEPTGTKNNVVFGRVVGVHIRDDLIVDGRVDILRVRPVSRLGYFDFAVIDELFEMRRPDWPLPSRKD